MVEVILVKKNAALPAVRRATFGDHAMPLAQKPRVAGA